jgi:DNA-binding transcriptional LysR family regulator
VPWTLRHLRYFVAVAEEGQFTAAARRLYVSQPAVSLALRELEEAVGGSLLTRHRGGVKTTELGAQLLIDARASLAQVDAALEAARLAARSEVEPAGSLTIGVLPYMMEIAHPLLEAFRHACPGVATQLQQFDFGSQLSALRAGAIGAELASFIPDDPALLVLPLLRSPVILFMASDHPLAARETVWFDDLEGETWVGRHPSVPIEFADVYWLTERRGHRPPVSADTPLTPDEAWAVIAAGRAICTSPEFIAKAILGEPGADKAGMVASRPLADVDPFVVALVRRRDNRDPLVHALFELAARMSDQVALGAA